MNTSQKPQTNFLRCHNCLEENKQPSFAVVQNRRQNLNMTLQTYHYANIITVDDKNTMHLRFETRKNMELYAVRTLQGDEKMLNQMADQDFYLVVARSCGIRSNFWAPWH